MDRRRLQDRLAPVAARAPSYPKDEVVREKYLAEREWKKYRCVKDAEAESRTEEEEEDVGDEEVSSVSLAARTSSRTLTSHAGLWTSRASS